MPVCFIAGKIYRKQEYEIKTETDCQINYIDDFKHIKFGIVWYLCYHIYITEEESTQKSVQDSVQDNGNSGGVFVGEYKPPFTITNEILSYVSSISEKIGRITAIRSLETKPHLRKNNRIKSIHSSLTTVARIPSPL